MELIISLHTLTKREFLSDPDVAAMMAWVADRFEAQTPWTHTDVDRKTGATWSCVGMADAFRQYSWNGKSWRANKTELDSYRRQLREAVDRRDVEGIFNACAAILRWGGVWANNGSYLVTRKPVLLDELLHLSSVLAAERTPANGDLLADPNDATSECRMNAGFVKIYSLLLDYCVIYDGRVGASLGLLARQFCEDSGHTAVPPFLAFAFGSPKEGPNPKNPKLRNPSHEALQFPRLRKDSLFYTQQTMRANWFLRGALEMNPLPFSKGENGFHELAAGLFMAGYDLKRDS